MGAELGHDGVHGLLVLLQEDGQLLVLVLQRLVLDDLSRVRALQLGLKGLCFGYGMGWINGQRLA